MSLSTTGTCIASGHHWNRDHPIPIQDTRWFYMSQIESGNRLVVLYVQSGKWKILNLKNKLLKSWNKYFNFKPTLPKHWRQVNWKQKFILYLTLQRSCLCEFAWIWMPVNITCSSPFEALFVAVVVKRLSAMLYFVVGTKKEMVQQ